MLSDEYPQVRMAVIAVLEKLQLAGEWRAHLKSECYVPAGEFIMGDKKRAADEKPSHKVTLEAFYIGRYPVTNLEYSRYCEEIGMPFELPAGKETHPVIDVGWYAARNYAAWAGMRLLTEAEWEKAASWEQVSETAEGEKAQIPLGRQVRQNEVQHKRSRNSIDHIGWKIFPPG